MVCDYNKAKIYVIKSNETDDVYIGSTCSTLKLRMCSHKSTYKKLMRDGMKHKSSANLIMKYSDAYIELLEEFPCETKRELLDREGECIRQHPNCVNIQIQGRTMEQYRIDNDAKLKQQGIDYRIRNKDMLSKKYSKWYYSGKGKAYLEKRKEKINVKVDCPNCGKPTSKSNLSRHKKSKSCISTFL